MFNEYVFIGSERKNKRGGGVGLCIHNQFKFKPRPDLCVFGNTCEAQFVEISKLKKNLIIGVCYRPPDQNVNDFNDKLHTALNIIDKERKNCVILGDFNIDLKKLTFVTQ